MTKFILLSVDLLDFESRLEEENEILLIILSTDDQYAAYMRAYNIESPKTEMRYIICRDNQDEVQDLPMPIPRDDLELYNDKNSWILQNKIAHGG